MILDCLKVPVNLEGIAPLQSASMMAVLDGFDRRIDRGFFVPLAANALALHTDMGRLHTMIAMQNIMAKPGDAEEKLKGLSEALVQSVKGLSEHAEGKQKELTHMIGLVIQCPTAEDTIS